MLKSNNKKTKASLLITILFFSLSFSLTVSSEIYKWTDENGKVHYSDKPVQKNSKKMSVKKGPSQNTIREAQSRASSLINHQRKVREINSDNARDKKFSDQQEKKKDNVLNAACRIAKNEIIMLGQRGAAYTTDEKGERHFLSDTEKNKMIQELKINVKKHC